MSSRRRRIRHPAESIPPELCEMAAQMSLCEVEGQRYIVDTDAQGRKSYLPLAELALELVGQPRPSPEHRVHYKNGDKLDNRPENLEWKLSPDGSDPSDNG
jgi:hypothetical protein